MLLELQRAFRGGILDNDGADVAVLAGMDPGRIARRLQIYRNNVHGSLAGVLASAFPVVQRLVGKPFFQAMARAFVQRHPPEVPQLSVYGARLPDFLESFLPVRPLAYLPDVARLEWARIEAYFAGDAAPMDPASLASRDPATYAALTFELRPAVRLVASRFPIQQIWEANQPEHDPVAKVDLAAGGERVVVFRPAMIVTAHVLGEGDYALLSRLAAGRCLGDASEAATAADAEFDLQQALVANLTRGIFAAAR